MIRKLVSKQDIKKKQKRNQYILGAILIFVMFGSVFGVIVGSFGEKENTEKIIYNGHEFLEQNNYYILNLGEIQFYFSEDPREIALLEKEINISKTLPDFIGKPLYVYSEDYSPSTEIYQNINSYVERIQPACLEDNVCIDSNWPIKTCEDNFILILESETNKIYEKDNCIFIEGKKEDLTKLTDEFLFEIMGINQ